MILLSVLHNPEFLFISRIFFRAVCGTAGFEALDQGVGVLHLGFVLEDGLHFDIPSVGDIYGGIGLVGKRAPDFLGNMRFETLRKQIREIGDVAGSWENRIQNDLSAGAVVGMIDAVGGEQSLRITGDEDIGLVPANFAYDVTAQIQVWDEVPVREVHEMN